MNTVVLLKMVPDVVEELEIGEDDKSLDTEWLRMILSEWCDHALEEALLLKEQYGGTVTAVALEAPEVDDALFTALAKGADRAVKLTGEFPPRRSDIDAAIFTAYLFPEGSPPPSDTLILAGSQAIDDLAGELGPYVAERLGLPYVGVVTAVSLSGDGGGATVRKEFAGGLRGEFEVSLPCVLGIQAAEKPPRYVPIAKVRAAMKSGTIEESSVPVPEGEERLVVDRMVKPEPSGRAEMLEGAPEEVAARLANLFTENGLI
jgi:electron transfer flavoprotein beta subunit